MTATLYGMRQSPWTEKARWALDHHRVPYDYREHVPLLGELALRRRAGSRRASVPMLVDGEQILPTSIAIARYADRSGGSATLFPRGSEDAIASYNELSDAMIGAGRSRVLARLAGDRDAQRESLPGFVPGPLRGVLGRSAGLAAKFLASKHDVPVDPDAETDETLRPALGRVRAELGGRPYLLDGFTFADVAIASALGVLRPADRMEIGPATRAMWTDEGLAAEFVDLLMWRDAVYAKHR